VGEGTNEVKVLPWVHTLIADTRAIFAMRTMALATNISIAISLNFVIVATAGSGNHTCLTESSRHALVKVPFLIQS
jgi:hypothetical protein